MVLRRNVAAPRTYAAPSNEPQAIGERSRVLCLCARRLLANARASELGIALKNVAAVFPTMQADSLFGQAAPGKKIPYAGHSGVHVGRTRESVPAHVRRVGED